MLEIAGEQVRERLKQQFGGMVEAVVVSAVEEVTKAVAEPAPPPARAGALAKAAAVVKAKADGVGVIEDDVAEWIKKGRLEEALAAIAHLADMPVETVVRAYEGVHHDPLLFIVRSVRFGWATLEAPAQRPQRHAGLERGPQGRLRGLPAALDPDRAARRALHGGARAGGPGSAALRRPVKLAAILRTN